MHLGILTNGRFSLKEENIFHLIEVQNVTVDIVATDTLQVGLIEDEILEVCLIVEEAMTSEAVCVD